MSKPLIQIVNKHFGRGSALTRAFIIKISWFLHKWLIQRLAAGLISDEQRDLELAAGDDFIGAIDLILRKTKKPVCKRASRKSTFGDYDGSFAA